MDDDETNRQLDDESLDTTAKLTTEGSSAEEFEALFHRSYERAFNAAFRLMGNAKDAEDLTQEAFVRVWAAFDRYDRTKPFEGWLFRILSNLAIDRWRRSAGMTVCSLDAAREGNSRARGGQSPENAGGASMLSCLADERTSVLPEQSLMRSETGRKVHNALSALPGDYRKVVVMADIKGYSYEEIAQHVGCPVGTIRSRLHRGRQLLRQNLVQQQGDDQTKHGEDNSILPSNLPGKCVPHSQDAGLTDRNEAMSVQKEEDFSSSSKANGPLGRGWHGDPTGHARAGRKGGTAVSRNREHMAQIGSKGGHKTSQRRRHMAHVGQKEGGIDEQR